MFMTFLDHLRMRKGSTPVQKRFETVLMRVITCRERQTSE